METTENQSLAGLITRACGDRSLSAYSRAVDISVAHLGRIRAGKCQPTKTLCYRMANDDYVKYIGVTAEDFLKAAGFNVEQKSDTGKTDNLVSVQRDAVALGVISKCLIDHGYEYRQTNRTMDEDVNFTFMVTLGDGNEVKWNIAYYFEESAEDTSHRNVAYYYNLGKIYSFKSIKAGEYVMNTLLVDDRSLYEKLIAGVDSKLLTSNISIAYVDVQRMIVQNESILSSIDNGLNLL